MELNRVVVFLSSPEEGNKSSFQNAVFYSYLDLRTMNEVHKPMILNEILRRFSDFQALKTVYMYE
jgi:hypothetical protein